MPRSVGQTLHLMTRKMRAILESVYYTKFVTITFYYTKCVANTHEIINWSFREYSLKELNT